jgi:hypothetical protein
MSKVWKKLRPGYTFHHPNGTALQRSLPEKDGSTTVLAFGKGGGSEDVGGPFFSLDEEAVATAPFMFEDPTAEELAMLKKKNPKAVAPEKVEVATIETVEVEKAPEDKRVTGKGEKEKDAPPPKKTRGRPPKGKKAAPKKD